jgi:hypothetical protein
MVAGHRLTSHSPEVTAAACIPIRLPNGRFSAQLAGATALTT